jgi:hypothetical protein
VPVEPTMAFAGKPANSDDGIEVRNPADLNYKENGIGRDLGRETGLWQYTQYKTISDSYHGA